MDNTYRSTLLVAQLMRLLLAFLIPLQIHGPAAPLTSIITADSLLGAIDTVFETLLGTLPETPLAHTAPLTHRYLYYAGIGGAVNVINALTWWKFQTACYYTLFVAIIPAVVSWIVATHEFDRLRTSILRPILTATGYLLCNCVAYIVNHVSIAILQDDPGVHYTEIARGIKSHDNLVLLGLIKSFTVAAIVKYLGDTGSYYGWILTTLYRYGILIQSENPPENYRTLQIRERLRSIVRNRRWELFRNPDVLRDVIDIYYVTENGTFAETIRSIINTLEICTARFFTLYAFGSICTHYRWVVISCTSALFLYMDYAHKGRISVQRVLFRVVAFAISLMNFGLVIEAAAFAYIDILDNAPVRWMVAELKRLCCERFTFRRSSPYSEFLLDYAAFCWIATYAAGPWATLAILQIAIQMDDFRTTAVAIALLGWCSGYRIVHLAVISVAVYAATHIQMRQPASTLNVDVVRDYDGIPARANHIPTRPLRINATGVTDEFVVFESAIAPRPQKINIIEDFYPVS